MAYVSGGYCLVDELAHEFVDHGEVASAVVAHVDYQCVAVFHAVEHVVQKGHAVVGGEGGVVHVAYVLILQNFVDYRAAGMVVETEVVFLDESEVEVLRVVRPPLAVVRNVEP